MKPDIYDLNSVILLMGSMFNELPLRQKDWSVPVTQNLITGLMGEEMKREISLLVRRESEGISCKYPNRVEDH